MSFYSPSVSRSSFFNQSFQYIEPCEQSIEEEAVRLENPNDPAKNDKSFVIRVLSKKPDAFVHISALLKENEEILQIVLSQNGLLLEHAGEIAKKNRELVNIAVKNNPDSFRFSLLQDDEEALLYAVSRKGDLFQYGSERLKKNPETVFAAGRSSPQVYRHAHHDAIRQLIQEGTITLRAAGYPWRADLELVRIAVEQDPEELLFSTSQVVKTLLKEDPLLWERMKNFLQDNPSFLYDLDLSVVKIILEKDGLILQYAHPSIKKNKSAAWIAIEQNPRAFQFVDPCLKDDLQIVSLAVGKDANMWEYTPEHGAARDNFNLMGRSIQENPEAFQWASLRLKSNRNLVERVLKKNGLMLAHVNESLHELVVPIAVKQNPASLAFVSNLSIVNKELEKNGLFFQYVSKLLNNNLSLMYKACMQNLNAADFIDPNLFEKSICLKKSLYSVMQNGLSLEYLSCQEKDDLLIVYAAVMQNAKAFQFASTEIKDDYEFVDFIVKKQPKILRYVTNFHILMKILQKNGLFFEYISDSFREYLPLMHTACMQNLDAAKWMDDDYERLQYCLSLVQNNGMSLQELTDDERDNLLIAYTAILQNPNALSCASVDLRNKQKFVELCIEKDPTTIRFASSRLQKKLSMQNRKSE